MMEFSAWLEDKYKEWWTSVGRKEGTITNFASRLGVSRQVLDKWLNRGSIPEIAQVKKIAKVYPDVYEALGMEKPNEDGIIVLSPMDYIKHLPAHEREPFTQAAREAALKIKELGLDPYSPEADKIWAEKFRAYGFKVN
jgi:transcriptional regulator with XRE-family HTH domain